MPGAHDARHGSQHSTMQHSRRQINLQHACTARAVLTPQAHRSPGTSVHHSHSVNAAYQQRKQNAFQSNKLCPQPQHVRQQGCTSSRRYSTVTAGACRDPQHHCAVTQQPTTEGTTRKRVARHDGTPQAHSTRASSSLLSQSSQFFLFSHCMPSAGSAQTQHTTGARCGRRTNWQATATHPPYVSTRHSLSAGLATPLPHVAASWDASQHFHSRSCPLVPNHTLPLPCFSTHLRMS